MAKALWHKNPSTSEILTEKLDSKGVHLKAKFSMISTGTESLIARGNVSQELEELMAVPFMKGSFDLPIKYGYSMIAETKNGSLSHLMHPHQDEFFVNRENLTLVPINLPPARATLVSNMETIINAIWDSNPTQTMKIAICGFGNIGSLLANSLRVHYNIDVSIIEINEWKKEKAISMGWKLAKYVNNFDIIYHTTSSESGLQYCIDHLEEEGSVIELSWYGNKEVKINLGKEFHYKRLKIISSQVGVIPIKMKDKFDYQSRKKMAFDMLNDDSYDQLITHIIPFSQAPEFYNKLRNGSQKEGLIYIIEY